MSTELSPHPKYRVDLVPNEVMNENAQNVLDQLARRHDLDITQVSEEEKQAAREALLDLPLVHRTSHGRFDDDPHNNPEKSLYDTPVPKSYLPSGAKSNTFPLDEQLNLDEYVFMTWGAVRPAEDTIGFLTGADTAVLIDPHILESDNTIVTCEDISMSVSVQQPLDENRTADVQNIERYLRTVVSGRDWLSIQATLLAAAKHRKSTPDMLSELTLGEIKYRGQIPQSAILATLDLNDKQEYDLYQQYVLDATMGVYEIPVFHGPPTNETEPAHNQAHEIGAFALPQTVKQPQWTETPLPPLEVQEPPKKPSFYISDEMLNEMLAELDNPDH